MEHVQRQLRPRIARLGRLPHVADVRADAADSQQSAAFGQVVQQFLKRLARRLHQHRQGEHVEIADPVVVRQSGLRAHAHRRRDALPPADRAQTVRTAEMARDDPQVFPPQQVGRPVGDVAMARAVKAPTLDLILLRPLVRHRVIPQRIGHRGVKTGLERGHQRDLRQLVRQQTHRPDVHRVVRRRDRIHLFHCGQHIGGDALHPAVTASVNGLETDRRHLGRIGQAPARRVGQLVQALPHCHRMVGNLRRQLLPAVADLHETTALGRADPFDAATSQLPPAVHIVQPVLETRGTEIRHQDLHDRLLRWSTLLAVPLGKPHCAGRSNRPALLAYAK